jgi:hypothetical protein
MGIRKALLVGIDTYADAPLRGCANDVATMRELLTRYYGFHAADIKLLLNDAATAAGIRAGLAWLAGGGDDPDAVRVFHYSGHGTYIADTHGDEPDGRDECLVPHDYKTAGLLVDDELKTLYDRFPRSGNLTLVMDCCHSGSINRVVGTTAYRFLPVSEEEEARIEVAAERFIEDQERFVLDELATLGQQLIGAAREAQRQILEALFRARRAGGDRTEESNILLAGCQDVQTSADALIGDRFRGAFTYALAEAIREANGQLTYRQAADRAAVRLATEGFEQIPQLAYPEGRDEALLFRPFA